MTDNDKPIKPLHGKLVTIIESKELYEEVVSREMAYHEWMKGEIQKLMEKDRYKNQCGTS